MKSATPGPFQQELARLREENQLLRARCASLEAQVMEMASQPEPEPNWWDRVIFIFDDDDDDEAGIVPEPLGA